MTFSCVSALPVVYLLLPVRCNFMKMRLVSGPGEGEVVLAEQEEVTGPAGTDMETMTATTGD